MNLSHITVSAGAEGLDRSRVMNQVKLVIGWPCPPHRPPPPNDEPLRTVAKSQSVLMMNNPVIFTRMLDGWHGVCSAASAWSGWGAGRPPSPTTTRCDRHAPLN
eukprot:COSAG01_NODE_3698_length_5784_cov_5.069129_7_plen_104_part_00